MKIIKKKNGYVLIMSIILLAFVMLMAMTIMRITIGELKMNVAQEKKTSARYLAEAGIEHGLYMLEKNQINLDSPAYSETVSLASNSSYDMDYTINKTVTIDQNGVSTTDLKIVLTATGRLVDDQGVETVHTITADIDNGNLTIEE